MDGAGEKRRTDGGHVDAGGTGKKKVNILLLRALELLLGIVFLGWVMMWVVFPTSTYRQVWMPKLRSVTNSKAFGSQGGPLLTFVLPVLFIAVVGCVYLHLKKLNGDNCNNIGRHGRIAIWSRRPALVKGPLGTISRIELVFVAAFLLLFFWCFATFLRVGFKSIREESSHELGDKKVWEAKLETAALRLGLLGGMCCAFLFFPVARASSILPLLGLTSEGSIKYHIWLGHIVMATFTAHGICYVIYWIVTGQISQMIKWEKTGVANVAGEIALVAGLMMWVSSIPRIRRKMFELFYYTHHLYLIFLLFFLLHVGISFFFYVLPGVFLFLVDRFLRFLQSKRNVRLVSARLLPCQAVELNFSKSPRLEYTPTSIVFINVPSISGLQWHPFTVTSSSNMEPEKLSVLIKREGSWTQKLYQALSSTSHPIHRLSVSIEGPYGPTSSHFLRHDALVMVSGGSGITPFISIIRELTFQSTKRPRANSVLPKRILLISAFKNSQDLTMLSLLLPMPTNPTSSHINNNNIVHINLQIEAFVTREKEPDDNTNNIIAYGHAHGLCVFKPRPSDEAMFPMPGGLWLGAIIAISFISYLILLALLNRFYIYPIDHNTNSIYSYAFKSLFSVLLICISIAAVATAALLLWNKKQDAMISDSEQHDQREQELESFPHQSLADSTKVHFGARPDLKKMILECEGSSVGVLACGPTKMRQEVATICSSPSAKQLHYESISFSW